MTIPSSFELANDSTFRVLANFTTPPRAGRITAIEASGQVRVATDDPDGGDVLAWPLNGFTYTIDDVVYVAFAANSPDTALVIGAKAPLPTLDAAVYSHDHDADYAAIAHQHDSAYVKQDGTTTLDANWDIGEDRRILAEAMRARDVEGLRLEDDAGNLGVFVEDGGEVGINTSTPHAPLEVSDASNTVGGRIINRNPNEVVGASATYYMLTGSGAIGSANALAFYRAVITQAAPSALKSELQFFYNAGDVATQGLVLSDSGNLGIGSNSPQGRLHAHDGTGGLLFVTKTGIGSVAQTLIPNGTGDVTGGLTGFFVVNDGSGAVANSLTLLPGDNLDVVVGSYTLRLALNVNGALTAVRQSGVGSATLALLALWI